jgi:hypothetical protein
MEALHSYKASILPSCSRAYDAVAEKVMSNDSLVRTCMLVSSVFLVLTACNSGTEKRFELLHPRETGIDFVNELNPTPELNVFNYLYYYDGGGVAAGDLNGDGTPDLYFTSSEGRNRLYVNRGDFRFEDVTDRAFGPQPVFWSTGVSLADINGDGMLDVYVSNVAGHDHFEGQNQLFINRGSDQDGIPRFEEAAAEYGLDVVGLSTQAVFFDCDRDMDLDLYVMNHSVHRFGTLTRTTLRRTRHPLAGDRLFRNAGGRFTEITDEAGIYSSALGYGLGVGIADLDGDEHPDIYVGNDFHEDDYLYLNNGDCTFSESLGEMIRHTSYSSMGNDLVDIDNDGLIDIISLDMLPEDYEQSKASAAEDPMEIYESKRSYGYKHQVSRNTLQLNRGKGKFSEIGMLAGVYATDWSWAALGADFDNDGHTDLFITNGIYRRTNDLDYIDLISRKDIQQRLKGELTEAEVALADHAPAGDVPNYMYRNGGSLFFEDVSKKWGFDQRTFTSGAAYVDLDNDGDLDLVTNNVNQPASVYRNMTRERFPEASNYLKVGFHGPAGNTFGVGVRITARREDDVILRELYPVRGFQSSVEPVIHVGLDSLEVIPELHVRWPDGKRQILRNIRTNQTLSIEYADAEDSDEDPPETVADVVFEDVTDRLGVSYKHEENSFNEFNRESLMPHMVSREGPALAVGDVDGNGLEDLFVGGAKRQPGTLFIQQQDGTLAKQELSAFDEDFNYEDVDAHFVDVTGDGSLDLLVVSGGNEYSGRSEYMQPRLYVNDGAGHFGRDPDRLPKVWLTGSVAAVQDVDGDGLADLFLGARAVPWAYGKRPTSYLLINRGDGYFDVDTTGFGKRFSDLGLVTDARWADMDGDGKPDLVVASEWSSLKIVYHSGGERIAEIPGSSGLWNTLALTDLDHDGRQDILAGNLGLNSKFKASGTAPLRMYVDDFDENGRVEQVVTKTDRDGRERLFATKDELAAQLPALRRRFQTYRAFGQAGLYAVIDRSLLDRANRYSVTELRSAVFYNRPDGFHKVALPVTSQFSPIRSFLVRDLNGDGFPDVISAGNFYNANIQRGRYDADYGNVLMNNGRGGLQHLPNRHIDWYLDGQIRKMEMIRIGDVPVMVVAKNDGPLGFFRIDTTSRMSPLSRASTTTSRPATGAGPARRAAVLHAGDPR